MQILDAGVLSFSFGAYRNSLFAMEGSVTASLIQQSHDGIWIGFSLIGTDGKTIKDYPEKKVIPKPWTGIYIGNRFSFSFTQSMQTIPRDHLERNPNAVLLTALWDRSPSVPNAKYLANARYSVASLLGQPLGLQDYASGVVEGVGEVIVSAGEGVTATAKLVKYLPLILIGLAIIYVSKKK